VRARIDWKYTLSLPLTDPGFDFSILSEERTRLLQGGMEQKLLDILLSRLQEKGLLKTPKQQRTDSTHVLAAIRTLNRLETLGEGMRSALDSLTVAGPEWLVNHIQCPQGHHSTKWLPGQDVSGKPVINVRFLGSTCRACPVRSLCTQSKTQSRELSFQPQAQQLALQTRRQAQHTPEFHADYRQRAGIEATHSQGIRGSALRRSRYIGLDKTHL